jgi:hypothetical protein
LALFLKIRAIDAAFYRSVHHDGKQEQADTEQPGSEGRHVTVLASLAKPRVSRRVTA